MEASKDQEIRIAISFPVCLIRDAVLIEVEFNAGSINRSFRLRADHRGSQQAI